MQANDIAVKERKTGRRKSNEDVRDSREVITEGV